jgi:hypothetical protein
MNAKPQEHRAERIPVRDIELCLGDQAQRVPRRGRIGGARRMGRVRDEWMAVDAGYRAALVQSNTLKFQDGFGESWITSTCVASLAGPTATQLENNLAQAGIDSRRWWAVGVHAPRATAGLPRALVSGGIYAQLAIFPRSTTTGHRSRRGARCRADRPRRDGLRR